MTHARVRVILSLSLAVVPSDRPPARVTRALLLLLLPLLMPPPRGLMTVNTHVLREHTPCATIDRPDPASAVPMAPMRDDECRSRGRLSD